jgi:hypothetical protein
MLVDGRAPVLASNSSAQATFLRHLLHMNDAIRFARVGVDECSQVVLSIEMPAEAVDLRLFLFALQTLAKYLERYSRELEILASAEEMQIIELLGSLKYNGTKSSEEACLSK